MRTTTLASVLAVAATSSAATTPKAENNPAGAHYRTEFDFLDQTGVWGYMDLKSSTDGKTVDLDFKFHGVAMSKGGPFTYHIHQKPLVGRDCATTGGHFDPYGAGTANCKEGHGELCEVGDLSGRFRPISVETDLNENGFPDEYMSLDPNNKAFVGDKSFVIHNAKNNTRVACGNFVKINGGNTGSPSTPAPVNGSAPVTNGNPQGVVYRADIDWLDQNGIHGFFEVHSGKDGKGTDLNMGLNGLKGPGAPYAYHIHEKPVSGRDCNSTGGHLNPYKAPAKCDASKRETCEVGDLSGKYGTIDATKYEEAFAEPYLSTNKEDKAFIGDKSIVFHDKDGKRVACASFQGKLVKPDGSSTTLPAGGIGGPTGVPCANSTTPINNGTAPGVGVNGTTPGNNSTVSPPSAPVPVGPSPPGTPGNPGSPASPTSSPALSTNSGSKLAVGAGALFIAVFAALL
ncbi:unnamed protein product [Periconia digitata]|uniref:Superoxide dismutase copper/zinc binding domain-containing protein n=1 Tax=Periconia digitata TaxID=1303443 RepID=A0A9W4XGX9_9PLEO|nr:unnamed protein product [Periconia digitata]